MTGVLRTDEKGVAVPLNHSQPLSESMDCNEAVSQAQLGGNSRRGAMTGTATELPCQRIAWETARCGSEQGRSVWEDRPQCGSSSVDKPSSHCREGRTVQLRLFYDGCLL